MIADSPLIGKIILILVLIAIDAFCSCAEIAVISLDASELEKMAEEKNKKAERLLKFLRQPAKFLTMIQAVITLCGFLISAFTADLLALWMTGLVMEQFAHLVSAKVWHNIFLVLITFLLSYVVLVFGILLPKRLAAKRGQKLAFRMSGLLEVFWIVFFAVYGSFKCDYKSSVTSFWDRSKCGGGGSQRGRDTENGRCRKQKRCDRSGGK